MPGNRFIKPKAGLASGSVALINSDIPGSRWFSTGVMVLYADEESFTCITPEGHPFSGWITFSAYRDEDRTWQHSQLGVDGGEVVRLSERFETERTVRKRAWMADRNQKADKLKC